MLIFFSDLDKTLIYSYKHDIGKEKELVEMYQGREVSYISKKTSDLLKKMMGTRKIAENNNVLFVPTTTRTIQQYNRITLPIEKQKFALVCNGGILLEEGNINQVWYKKSLEIIKDSNAEIKKAISILEKDESVNFEIRYIEDLFVFTKSEDPQKTLNNLKESIDQDKVDVFLNGVKVYAVPKKLTKGNAVKRFIDFYKNNIKQDDIKTDDIKAEDIKTVAAGDSLFDISMLESVDQAFAPFELLAEYPHLKNIKTNSDNQLFSEKILESLLE